jgi:nucleotide-binding universal stress UspA family protein
MVKIKKILVPVDFSESTAKILPYALSVARQYAAEVILLNVVRDLTSWETWVPHPSIEEFAKQALSGAEKAMESFCEENSEELKACASYEKKVVAGDPAAEIIETVKSENADMIIMGTHGRKGLEHTIFGSVAENVLRKSSVPVMTVNPHKV